MHVCRSIKKLVILRASLSNFQTGYLLNAFAFYQTDYLSNDLANLKSGSSCLFEPYVFRNSMYRKLHFSLTFRTHFFGLGGSAGIVCKNTSESRVINFF